MNLTRRAFLASLAAAGAAIAVGFKSAVARRTDYTITQGTQAVEVPIYARAGDRVTCENGHHICTFISDVRVGDDQLRDGKIWALGDWQVPEPEIGTNPICPCGADWVRGAHYHFEHGAWRNTCEGTGQWKA